MKRRRPSTSAYNISNNSIAEPKVAESPPVIPNSSLRSNSIPSSCRSRRRQSTTTATIRQLFIFYIFVMPIFEISSAATGTIFEDYKECRDHELFGNVSLICDPEHKLQRPTLRRLDSLLRDLQSKIDCECENGCVRGDGLTNRYIGLLLVTNSAKIDAAAADGAVAESLNETSRRIFEDARLGDAQCDNGLLIIYIKDQQKLATYRGSGRFALLNDADMAKLHEIALSKGAASPAAATAAAGEDSVALQYLLSNYESQRGGGGGAESVLRAENWAPIIGLTVALVIVLLVLAALLALLFAKLCSRCCCCSCCASDEDAERKDKYYVAQQHHGAPSTYKTIEPIYIVTPTMSEHGGGLPPMSISAPLGVPPSSAHHYHHSSMHPQPHTRPSSVHSRRRYQNRHSVVQQQQHSPSSAVTNAMTDNGGGAYSIYNSPLYGSSPQSPPCMPLPPLPPPPQMYVGGGGLSRGQRVSAGSAPIVTQSSRSRSLTPTSTHRTRVYPQHSVASTSTMQGGGGGGGGFDVRSPDQTPQNRRDKMNRNSTIMSRYSNATYYTAGGCNGSVVDATDHHHHYPTTMKNRPASTASNLQLIPSGSSQKQQPNTNNTDSTSTSELEELGSPRLPFLDPFRKREVQTKKEFIS